MHFPDVDGLRNELSCLVFSPVTRKTLIIDAVSLLNADYAFICFIGFFSNVN